MALLEACKRMKTKDKKPCVAFVLAEDPEGVRVSQETLNGMRDSLATVMEAKDLVNFIIQSGNQEKADADENGGTFKGRTVRDAKRALGKMGSCLEKEMEKAKDAFKEIIEKQFSSSFTRFLESLNEPKLGEKLEKLIAQETKEKRIKKEWNSLMREEISRVLDALKEETARLIGKCLESLLKIIPDQIRVKEFDRNPVLNFLEAKRPNQICIGPGGIAKLPDKSHFAVLSADGAVGVIDGSTGQLANELLVPSHWKEVP